MTREFHDISLLLFHTILHKLITPVVIANLLNSDNAIFSVLQLPSSSVPLLFTLLYRLEQLLKYQLLKYQLGVWVAPTTNFTAGCSYPSSSTNYSSEDIFIQLFTPLY